MITAVDTNILIDVLQADPTFGVRSREALREAIQAGALIASEVVWAETSARFSSEQDAAQAFDEMRIRLVPTSPRAAFAAGAAWRAYRKNGGGRRDRMIADFLVGAHAESHADQLLTRDAGFYRKGFKQLRIVDPSG